MLGGKPFVLIDDARPGGAATLYRDPVRALPIGSAAEVAATLTALRGALAEGHHVAGWLGYEAGHALEPRLAALATADAPLGWFGLFGPPIPLGPGELAGLLPDPAGAWIGAPRPEIDEAGFAAAFDRVAALIAAGDIYQANLSFRAAVPCLGHPAAVYARLRRTAAAGWCALVFDGARWLLSLSPELFFRVDGGRIEARPMKGTGARGADAAGDDRLAEALRSDPKQRAENLMIVDLMRNDLARVARPGSVAVPELFTVERYPTVQQLVSTVTADLAEGRDALDALEALFPCGSITGAPKLRAMEVIAEVETSARGAYTGAIGALAPDGSGAFNVAIRTLMMEEGHARIGLGAGIVADSDAGDEWRECLAKGAFLTMEQQSFDLIETIRFDPEEGLVALDRHMARLKASAQALDFAFDRHAAANELHAATFRRTTPAKVRVLLSRNGALAIELRDPPPAAAAPVTVAILPLPVDPQDFRLRHKTSDRAFYDRAREASGAFEVVFMHPTGVLTEGSFTNIFVERNGGLTTPPLALGLMPGALRARLIDEGRAVEGAITPADLAGGFWIGNALRGLIPARLA